MILKIQEYWNRQENPEIKAVCEKFQITAATARRYIHMSGDEIKSMDKPKNYKKRESPMNKWLNVIYKMMRDGRKDETIYFYICGQPEFTEKKERLAEYIMYISKNNFPDRIPLHPKYLMERVLPQMYNVSAVQKF